MLKLAEDITIERIVDIDPGRMALDFLFPGATLDALLPHRDWLEPHHVDFATSEVILSMQSHLIRIGGRNILVDTCVGDCKQRPKRPNWHDRKGAIYLRNLAAVGLSPEDIDVVFCTHLHADHAGWNTQLVDGRWVQTFPNARYLVGKEELDYWLAEEAKNPGMPGHGVIGDSVLPIVEAGLMETVDDGADLGTRISIASGRLSSADLAGHSPGQMGLWLTHPEGRALFCGDAVHNVAQLARPDWSSQFCSDPEQAARLRHHLFDAMAETSDMLIPAHLRGAMALCVRPDGAAWKPDWVWAEQTNLERINQ
ncbi:MBL fold metallo-hydrolase (plasmid) [Thioclava sp. 'Guangxiensis']|uniref:MBL fold metallo-hydrolase n=1 Tax=Thioclava sp. 'Guangxiensis' TaxID=3149044 RepID=UPI0032C3D7F3